MKEIKRVYICGLGAVGSAYASKIYDMNPDMLKIIADKERISRYTSNGVIVGGKAYSFQYLHPDEDAPSADLIIIAVKQHHLEQTIKDIKKFVGPQTIIISLLNGISSEEIISLEYGEEHLLYAMCVGIDAVRIGTSTEFSSTGRIVFGEKNNDAHSPRVLTVKKLLDRAQINYVVPENIIRELWWKFMLNVGINQVSAVLKAKYEVFQKIKEAQELHRHASLEVVMISQKAGIGLTERDINKTLEIFDKLSPEGKTSMLQDIEAKRKTEVEIFSGAVIELGKKYKVPTPVNDMLYRIIRTMEQTY